MKRRTVLAASGLSLSTSIAGCFETDRSAEHTDDATNGEQVEQSNSTASQESETPPSNSSESPSEPSNRSEEETDEPDEGSDDDEEIPRSTQDLTKAEFDPEETYKQVDVGDPERVDEPYEPHDVRLWAADADRTLELRLIDANADSVAHEETYDVPHDTELSVSLVEPSEWLIEICVPADETELTLNVPCMFFDCLESATIIGSFDNGELRSEIYSQRSAGCGPPDCT